LCVESVLDVTSGVPMTTTHEAPAPSTGTSGSGPGARVLAGLLVLRFAAILLGVGATALVVRATGGAAPWTTAVTWSAISVVVVADVLTVAVLTVVLRREGRGLRDLLGPLGVGATAWRTLVAFVVLYVAFAAGGMLGALLTGPAAPGAMPQIPLWFGLWNLLVLPVTVAVAEEFLYRGYLQPRLAARIGTPGAVLLVAAAFALQHVGLAAVSGPAVVTKLAATFVAGLALGLLALWFRRLLPLVLAHWMLDVIGIGVPMLMLSLAG
jgi:uncharacterized protein